MLSRGNSDAAIRLRRAKSTSLVPKNRPTPNIIVPDPLSTYNNAKTAATKAFAAAHGFVSRGHNESHLRRKCRSEGPGSHLARQRSKDARMCHGREHTTSSFGKPYTESDLVSRGAIGKIDPPSTKNTPSRTGYSSFPSEEGVHDCVTTSHISLSVSPKAGSSPSRSMPSKWEMLQPLDATPSHVSNQLTNTATLEAYQTSVAPVISPEQYAQEHLSQHSPLPPKESAESPFYSSQTSIRDTSTPYVKQGGVLRKLKNRSKSLGDGFNIVRGVTNTDEDKSQQTLRKVPSSLKVLRDTYKRKFGRRSRAASSKSEIPVQQVEARQSHHFGSSRLSNREPENTVEIKALESGMDDRPPTPPQHVWGLHEPKFPRGNDHILQDLDGTSFEGSRLTSWADSSDQNTVSRRNISATGSLEQRSDVNEGSAAAIFSSVSTTFTPKLKIPRRKSSALLRGDSGVDSQRVYSALVKRISENDNAETEQTSSSAHESQPEPSQDKHALPPIREIKSPSPAKSESPTIRIVKNSSLRGEPVLNRRDNAASSSRENVVSPSIYSPYPWANSHPSQQSVTSLGERMASPTGTAFVSPSQPFATWCLQPEPSEEIESRLLTSGDWRDWASDKISQLDRLGFKPPSIRVREPTDELGDYPPACSPHKQPDTCKEDIKAVRRCDSISSQTNEQIKPTHLPTLPSRQSSQQSLVGQRTSSTNTLGQAQHSKAFAFARRPSTHLSHTRRVSSASTLAPLNEQPPSIANARNSLTLYPPSPVPCAYTPPQSENEPPRAKTPDWVAPPLTKSSSQTFRRIQQAEQNAPSPLSDRFLRDIRRGPYAESVASTSSAQSSPGRKKAASPKDLAQLRVRRTRRRMGNGHERGSKEMVDEFLREREREGTPGSFL